METIEDIAREMREYGSKPPLRGAWLDLADRIKAALKREKAAIEAGALTVGGIVAATTEKSSAVGNAAKMREALSDACYAMFNFLKTQNGGYEEMAKALDKAKATLAAPPRNCDLYTDYGDALRAFEDDEDAESYEDMGEWLFAKAKGE